MVFASLACTSKNTRNEGNERKSFWKYFLTPFSRDSSREFSMQLDFLVAFEYAEKSFANSLCKDLGKAGI